MPRMHATHQTEAQSLVLYEQGVVCTDLTSCKQNENTIGRRKCSKNQPLAKSSEAVKWKYTDMHLFFIFSADDNEHILFFFIIMSNTGCNKDSKVAYKAICQISVRAGTYIVSSDLHSSAAGQFCFPEFVCLFVWMCFIGYTGPILSLGSSNQQQKQKSSL